MESDNLLNRVEIGGVYEWVDARVKGPEYDYNVETDFTDSELRVNVQK